MLSSLRGYVQPQWVIVSCFGLVCVLFAYARRHPRTRRYVMRAGGRDRRTDRPGATGDDLQSAGHPFRGVQQSGELRRHRRRGRRPSGGFPLRLRRCGQICVLYGRRGLLPAQYPLPYASVAVPRRRFAVHRPRSARRMPGRDRLGQHPAGADPHDGQRPEFHLVRRSGFPPRTVGGHRLYGPARAGGRGARRCASNCASGIPIPMRSAWVRATRSW